MRSKTKIQDFLALPLLMFSLATPLRARAEPAAAPSGFSLETTVETSSSLHAPDDPSFAAETDVTLAPALKLPGLASTLSGGFLVAQSMTQERELKVVKSSLSLRHDPLPLNPRLSFSPAVGMGLPLYSDSRTRESFLVSASVAPRLMFDFNRDHFPLTGFYELSAARRFHEYEVATTGESNLKYAVNQRLLTNLAIYRGLYTEITLQRSQGFTYAGGSIPKFDFNEELGWSFDSGLVLGVGLNNAGSALAANGRDSNVAFFNSNASTVYGLMTYTF
jgi:hypothetical protein